MPTQCLDQKTPNKWQSFFSAWSPFLWIFIAVTAIIAVHKSGLTVPTDVGRLQLKNSQKAIQLHCNQTGEVVLKTVVREVVREVPAKVEGKVAPLSLGGAVHFHDFQSPRILREAELADKKHMPGF
jgi:hypothetical protein